MTFWAIIDWPSSSRHELKKKGGGFNRKRSATCKRWHLRNTASPGSLVRFVVATRLSINPHHCHPPYTRVEFVGCFGFGAGPCSAAVYWSFIVYFSPEQFTPTHARTHSHKKKKMFKNLTAIIIYVIHTCFGHLLSLFGAGKSLFCLSFYLKQS